MTDLTGLTFGKAIINDAVLWLINYGTTIANRSFYIHLIKQQTRINLLLMYCSPLKSENKNKCYLFYYIPINDTTSKLSIFWPSDTESRINELRFSDSISLSFKTRLKSVTCFCGDILKSKFQAWNQRQKHDGVTSRNVTLWQTFPQFFRD